MEPIYLEPTQHLDCDHPEVIRFAQQTADGLKDPVEQTRRLFTEVRDRFPYDPFHLDLRKEALKASKVLGRKTSYCVEKAILLAASLRVLGIPSRLYFGNVRNHIGTGKLEELLGSDVLAFHGSAEAYLNGKWLKITPAFNKELCQRLGVEPLEFDGENDAIFQQYSGDRRFMEYLTEHGSFADMPYELYINELRKHYGDVFAGESLVYDLSRYLS